jgi:hypothetical protein
MDRRALIVAGLSAAAVGQNALAQDQPPPDEGPPGPPPGAEPPPQGGGPPGPPAQPYEYQEVANQVSDFFGVTAENAASLVEKLFRDNGRPTAYVAGIEGSGAFFFGLRYGRGFMYMKNRERQLVYWQGPTGGFDFGADTCRVFTLCYDLYYPDSIYRRFPGVEGSAYLIGGLGVNYQRADGITLAPIRAGVGFRLGASVGYLAYSRQRNLIPL